MGGFIKEHLNRCIHRGGVRLYSELYEFATMISDYE